MRTGPPGWDDGLWGVPSDARRQRQSLSPHTPEPATGSVPAPPLRRPRLLSTPDSNPTSDVGRSDDPHVYRHGTTLTETDLPRSHPTDSRDPSPRGRRPPGLPVPNLSCPLDAGREDETPSPRPGPLPCPCPRLLPVGPRRPSTRGPVSSVVTTLRRRRAHCVYRPGPLGRRRVDLNRMEGVGFVVEKDRGVRVLHPGLSERPQRPRGTGTRLRPSSSWSHAVVSRSPWGDGTGRDRGWARGRQTGLVLELEDLPCPSPTHPCLGPSSFRVRLRSGPFVGSSLLCAQTVDEGTYLRSYLQTKKGARL